MRSIPNLLIESAALVDSIGRMTRDWYSRLDEIVKGVQSRVPVTGQVTFAAATSAAVTLATAQPDTSYIVHYDAPEDQRVWTTSKTTAGFTANVSSASSATFGYSVTRL